MKSFVSVCLYLITRRALLYLDNKLYIYDMFFSLYQFYLTNKHIYNNYQFCVKILKRLLKSIPGKDLLTKIQSIKYEILHNILIKCQLLPILHFE